MPETTEMEPKKKRGRKPRHPQFAQEMASPGETGGIVQRAMAAWALSPIDSSDIEQVKARTMEYLTFCQEQDCVPHKTALCAWLGIDRTTLHAWERGEYRRETHYAYAQKVASLMEGVLVDLMANNKILPGNGCFLLKNHSGYRDQIDIAPAPQDPLGALPDPEALAAKIEAKVVEE